MLLSPTGILLDTETAYRSRVPAFTSGLSTCCYLRRVSYKIQILPIIRDYLGLPPGWIRVAITDGYLIRYRNCLPFESTWGLPPGWVRVAITDGYLIRYRNCLPFESTWGLPPGWVRVAITDGYLIRYRNCLPFETTWIYRRVEYVLLSPTGILWDMDSVSLVEEIGISEENHRTAMNSMETHNFSGCRHWLHR